MIVGSTTSHEIWECLRQHFAQQSIANAANIRFQLLDMSKGTRTINEYLQHAKSLADSLAAINEPVSNADLVTATLRGLGPDYAMLVTAILNFPPLPIFSDLRARLLSFESQNARASPQPISQAFVAAAPRGQPPFVSPFQRPSSGFRGHRGRGFGRNQWHQSNRGRNFGRGFYHGSSAGILRSAPPRPPFCNTCFFPGHVAAHCPNRPVPPPFAGLHFTPPPPPFSAGLPSATVYDANWYLDTGATHHVTHNGATLQDPTPPPAGPL